MDIRYTYHANERMKQRKIGAALIQKAIDKAVKSKQQGCVRIDLGINRVVADINYDTATIITVYGM